MLGQQLLAGGKKIGEAAAEAAAADLPDRKAGLGQEGRVDEVRRLVVGDEADPFALPHPPPGRRGHQRRFSSAQKSTDKNQLRGRHLSLLRVGSIQE